MREIVLSAAWLPPLQTEGCAGPPFHQSQLLVCIPLVLAHLPDRDQAWRQRLRLLLVRLLLVRLLLVRLRLAVDL